MSGAAVPHWALTKERVLQEGVNRLGQSIYLIFRPAGTYPAGSRSIEAPDTWFVSWYLDNARHGRSFNSPAAARECFDNLNVANRAPSNVVLFQVGRFTFKPGVEPGNIWIEQDDGEGGDFAAAELEAAIVAFYRENF